MRVGERSLEYRARPVKVYGWRIKVTSHPNSPRKTGNEGDLKELSLKLVLRAFVTLVQRNGQRTFVILGADQEDRSLWKREKTCFRRAYNSVAFCKLSKSSGLWQVLLWHRTKFLWCTFAFRLVENYFLKICSKKWQAFVAIDLLLNVHKVHDISTPENN